MSSSIENFWKAAGRWDNEKPRIVVEFVSTSSPFMQKSFVSSGCEVCGTWVTFCDEENGAELSLDFAKAEVRCGGFDKISEDEIVAVFRVAWDDEPFVRCNLTELRELGGLN